jgi:hypothetical protein
MISHQIIRFRLCFLTFGLRSLVRLPTLSSHAFGFLHFLQVVLFIVEVIPEDELSLDEEIFKSLLSKLSELSNMS